MAGDFLSSSAMSPKKPKGFRNAAFGGWAPSVAPRTHRQSFKRALRAPWGLRTLLFSTPGSVSPMDRRVDGSPSCRVPCSGEARKALAKPISPGAIHFRHVRSRAPRVFGTTLVDPCNTAPCVAPPWRQVNPFAVTVVARTMAPCARRVSSQRRRSCGKARWYVRAVAPRGGPSRGFRLTSPGRLTVRAAS